MMRGQKLKSHQEKVSAEKPEVRGICLLPDSSDVWSWGSNRVKEAPPPAERSKQCDDTECGRISAEIIDISWINYAYCSDVFL